MSVILLATFDTKFEEADYLIRGLAAQGIEIERCDISLGAQGAQWSPAAKLAGMAKATEKEISKLSVGVSATQRIVLAIGGGTGGQIVLQVLRSLPVDMPKILVTTLPFDPRYALADNAVILVPTVADLCGLNATTRIALDQSIAITYGLHQSRLSTIVSSPTPSIALTTLGVTGLGSDIVRHALQAQGEEVTVFYANGFGGAALSRWAQSGAFKAVIDYTSHELTRLHVGGEHTDMPGAVYRNGSPAACGVARWRKFHWHG